MRTAMIRRNMLVIAIASKCRLCRCYCHPQFFLRSSYLHYTSPSPPLSFLNLFAIRLPCSRYIVVNYYWDMWDGPKELKMQRKTTGKERESERKRHELTRLEFAPNKFKWTFPQRSFSHWWWLAMWRWQQRRQTPAIDSHKITTNGIVQMYLWHL